MQHNTTTCIILTLTITSTEKPSLLALLPTLLPGRTTQRKNLHDKLVRFLDGHPTLEQGANLQCLKACEDGVNECEVLLLGLLGRCLKKVLECCHQRALLSLDVLGQR